MATEIISETAADTAKKIRKALKKEFPDLPARHFKVRSSTYAGGSSVRVGWEDYPSEYDVRKVTDKFSSSTFDGMTDYEDTHGYVYEEDGKKYVGASYILTSREISDERDKAIREEMGKIEGLDLREGSHEWRVQYYKADERLDENRSTKERQQKEGKGTYLDFRNNYKVNHGNMQIIDAVEKAFLKVDLDTLGRKGTLDKQGFKGSKIVYRLVDETYKGGKHFNKLDDTTRGWLVSRVLHGGVYEIAIEDLLKECKSEKEFVKKLVPTTIPFVKHSLRELCDRKKQRVELDMKDMVADLAEEYHAKHVGNKEYKDKIDELRGDFISNVKIGHLGTAELDYEKAMLELRGLYQKEFDKVEKSFSSTDKKTEDKKDVEITENDLKLISKVINEQAEKEGAKKSVVAKRVTAKGLKKLKRENPNNFEDALREKLAVTAKNNKEQKEKNKEQGAENGDKSTTNTKTKAVKKEYARVRTLTEEVMEYLLEGEVQLQFTKANGEVRDMRATRSTALLGKYPNLAQAFQEGNSKENIGTELNQGTISVVDLDIEGGGARKFVAERLISFQPKGKEKIEVVFKKENEQEDKDVPHFDPTKLSTEEMIEILGKKVVRLVFEKKDGTKRAMIATRNPNIVKLYVGLDRNGKRPVNNIEKDKEKDIEAQIQKDYVKVLDVEKKAFRTFKPSKLVRYDDDLDISSWMEFTENNDAWYQIAINGKNPKDYYIDGRRGGANIGKGLSERIAYEREQEERVRDEELARETIRKSGLRAEKIKKQKSERRKRLEEVHSRVLQVVKEIEPREEFEDIYKDILRVPRKLENDKAFNNMENEITKVQKNDKNKIMIVQVHQDYIYLHPLFIVNGYSGNVYIDRTPEKTFNGIGEVRKSDADWGSEDVLEPIVKKIKALKLGTSKKNEKKEISESSKKRNERMIKLGKERQKYLAERGVRVSEFRHKEGKDMSMLKAQVGTRTFLIHSDFVVETVDSKAHVVFKSDENARVTGFKEFFSDVAKSADSEAEVKAYKTLEDVVVTAIDLRKRVS